MIRTLVAFLIALLLVTAPGYAFQRFGIVLLHGKTGTPAQFAVLADNLADLGYLVETPEMCWSASRIYDRSFTGCFEDIDAAIDRVNADGAEGIVVAGHSLGGVGALAYGASHDGLAGVIALAPAGDPVRFASVPAIALSMARARRAVAAGDGDTTITLDDFVLGMHCRSGRRRRIFSPSSAPRARARWAGRFRRRGRPCSGSPEPGTTASETRRHCSPTFRRGRPVVSSGSMPAISARPAQPSTSSCNGLMYWRTRPAGNAPVLITTRTDLAQTSRDCATAASMNEANSGCGANGRDFSSGWN